MTQRVDQIKKTNKLTKTKKQIKDKDRITCPHCGENVFVNAGKLLGKKSGEARIGQSVIMRELVELRWNKVKKYKPPKKTLKSKY